MSSFAFSFLNLDILKTVYPYILDGLWRTLLLAAAIVPASLLVGLLVACAGSFRHRALDIPLVIYVDFFRAFPPLVLLVFVYYALPYLGIELDTFGAVVLALTLTCSAYFGEVFRAGIESIPEGQIEASRATGLGRTQTLLHIVLPQAVRNMLPDLLSNVLETVKLTSLASVVTFPELLRMARMAQGNTLNATPLLAAALIYLVLLWPLVRLVSRQEQKALRRR